MESVVITGGTGMLGRALIPRLLARGVHVTVFSRSEKAQLALRAKWPQVRWLLGDVCDRAFLRRAFDEVEVVIHAAALKHVDTSEREPEEYVRVNTEGTRNVMDAAREAGCLAVIGISTDKACEPRNVYGLTKALMERMFLASPDDEGPCFSCVRYGNVFGSDGSVIPVWRRQLADYGRFGITHPDMTRFFFRVEDAVDEVLWAADEKPSGVIAIPPIGAVSIGDLAKLIDGPFKVVGLRPGEKMHEYLMSQDEGERAWRSDSDSGRMILCRKQQSAPLPAYCSATAPRLPLETLKEWLTAL